MSEAELHRRLRDRLGPDGLRLDPESLADFSVDIAGGGAVAAAVVRPRDLEALSETVAISTSLGYAVVPRGGGHSYTGGTVPAEARAVVFDLTALDRVVEIDDVEKWVRVEAGCTWAKLHDALTARGLRTPFFGPLSGYRATIGGALSQRAAFFGSAAHGFSDDGVLGLAVVLADGRVMDTGLGGGGHPHPRPGGPDPTPLFLGDCGAFGIKAEARLRVIDAPGREVFASFDFADMDHLLQAQIALVGGAGVAEVFGFDPASHANLARGGFGLMEGAEIVADVARRPGGLGAAAHLLRQGRARVGDMRYSLHLVVEGGDEGEALGRLAKAGALALAAGGRAVPDTIPRITRSRPFRPIKALLGPDGERWLPVHGVFSLRSVRLAHEAIGEMLESHRARLDEHGIRVSLLTVTSGDAIILEPQLFWPDSLGRFHARNATEAQVRRHAGSPERPAAREYAHRLRAELGESLRVSGAEHLQIGRYYPYEERLDPAVRRMMRAVKRSLDPKGLMAPGVLFDPEMDGGDKR